MANKKHLTKADRDKISELYLQGCTRKEIAEKINRHISTIRRELIRGYNGEKNINGANAYDPQLAEDNYRKMLVLRKAFKFKR